MKQELRRIGKSHKWEVYRDGRFYAYVVRATYCAGRAWWVVTRADQVDVPGAFATRDEAIAALK